MEINEIIPVSFNAEMLRRQKEILINMIQDWGEASDPQQQADAKEAEGLLGLIDHIQDQVVEVSMDENIEEKVFGNQNKED